MSEQEIRSADGTCIISEEVIAGIACNAACEIPGIAGPAQRPANIHSIIGSANTKAVKVTANEAETILDVYLNVSLGVRLQDVAVKVQKNVKSAVQSMTNKPVTKVNVHIMGIVLEDGTKAKIGAEAPQEKN